MATRPRMPDHLQLGMFSARRLSGNRKVTPTGCNNVKTSTEPSKVLQVPITVTLKAWVLVYIVQDLAADFLTSQTAEVHHLTLG